MSVKSDIAKRVIYHKECIHDCSDHIRSVWEHYEDETRKGLDEYQLKELLVWRKTEIAKAEALKEFHNREKVWLNGLFRDI